MTLRELPIVGSKAVLLERLQTALVKPTEEVPAVVQEAEKKLPANELVIPAKRVLEDALPGGSTTQGGSSIHVVIARS